MVIFHVDYRVATYSSENSVGGLRPDKEYIADDKHLSFWFSGVHTRGSAGAAHENNGGSKPVRDIVYRTCCHEDAMSEAGEIYEGVASIQRVFRPHKRGIMCLTDQCICANRFENLKIQGTHGTQYFSIIASVVQNT